jgi:hypothetical protein
VTQTTVPRARRLADANGAPTRFQRAGVLIGYVLPAATAVLVEVLLPGGATTVYNPTVAAVAAAIVTAMAILMPWRRRSRQPKRPPTPGFGLVVPAIGDVVTVHTPLRAAGGYVAYGGLIVWATADPRADLDPGTICRLTAVTVTDGIPTGRVGKVDELTEAGSTFAPAERGRPA